MTSRLYNATTNEPRPPVNPLGHVAGLYHRSFADRLVAAGRARDYHAMDRVTDELAAAGLVRHRSDGSVFESIAVRSRSST